MSDYSISKKGLFKFIIKHFWYFKWHSLVHVSTLLIYIALLTYSPHLIRYIADGSRDIAVVLPQIVGMTLLIAVSFRIYHYIVWVNLLPKLKQQLSNYGFSALLGHEYAYYVKNTIGDLSKRRIDMANEIPNLYMCICDGLLVSISLVIGALLSLAILPVKYVILVSVWCISFFILAIIYAKPIATKSTQVASNDSQLNGIASDICHNMLTVRFFNGYQYEKQKFAEKVEINRKIEVELEWYYYILFTLYNVGFIGSVYYSMIWFFADYKLGLVTLGDISCFYHIMFILSSRLWQITDHLQKFITQIGKIKNAYQLFIEDIQQQKVMKSVPMSAKRNINNDAEKVGAIEFQNVTFGYKENRLLFNKFNIKINAGDKIGIIGHSGGGKTTFVNLLLGLFDNYTGNILINNQNIKEISKAELYQMISVITQQSMLFNRTIYENLLYGRLNATKEEIISATKLAQAHTFITELDNGYDTLIAESGASLSGGQKQRLAIARTILRDTPIVVFDEFTSQLDLLNESIICENIMNVMREKTLFIIAHRLSTIKHMDKILVFDNGHIIAQGTHAELHEKSEIYRNLKKHGHFE